MMAMKRFIPLAAVFCMAMAGTVGAEEISDDDFFGDSVVSDAPVVEKAATEDAFTAAQPLSWGGSYHFNVDVNGTWAKEFDQWTSDYFWNFSQHGESSAVRLGADLFFVARPSSSQRYYGKLKLDYPFELSALTAVPDSTIPVPNIKIWELYADFDIDKVVNIRAGKQMTKWGVGYFFQPADVISLSPVDPADPEVDREGPVMVKANIPFDVHNLDFYVIAPEGMSGVADLAYAARAKFLVGNTQLGIGARYQHVAEGKLGSPFQAIATVSTSVWKFSLFGEGVLKYGSSRQFVERASPGQIVGIDPDGAGPLPELPVPTGLNVVTKPDTWFANASAGFIFTDSDNYLTIMGQYLYNGEGYSENLSDKSDQIMMLLGTGALNMLDVQNLSQHYAAALLRYDFTNNSKVHFSTYWQGNLQDGSGFVNPKVSFDISDEITLGLKGSVKYGAKETEYGSNPILPRLSLGFDLSLAPGTF